jgi:hypothetical protein
MRLLFSWPIVLALVNVGCKKVIARLHGGDAGTTTIATAPGASPAELEKQFTACDITGDGTLSGTEIARCSAVAADADADGRITKAEFLAEGLVPRSGGVQATNVDGAPANEQPAAIPTSVPAPATPTRRTPTPAADTPANSVATPATKPSGGLPIGRYRCHTFVFNVGLITTGEFHIVSPTGYRVGSDAAVRVGRQVRPLRYGGHRDLHPPPRPS